MCESNIKCTLYNDDLLFLAYPSTNMYMYMYYDSLLFFANQEF